MSFGPDHNEFLINPSGVTIERAFTQIPVIVFDRNLLSTNMDLSRAHRGSQGEKKDGRMPYKQGGSIRKEITSKPSLKRPNGGNNNGSNGGPRPH